MFRASGGFFFSGGFSATVTPPKFNTDPETCWLEDWFPFGARPIFRGELLNFGRVAVFWVN